MVQCLWVRLVDEENIHLIHGFLGPYLAQELSRRLGHLMVFSPMEPDGDYELDLEARDKRLVANCLLQLAHRECPKQPSECLQNQRYATESDEEDHFEAPAEWAGGNIPRRGVWRCRFISQAPKQVIRRTMATKMLGWAFDDAGIPEHGLDVYPHFYTTDSVHGDCLMDRLELLEGEAGKVIEEMLMHHRSGAELWEIPRRWLHARINRKKGVNEAMQHAGQDLGHLAAFDVDLDHIHGNYASSRTNVNYALEPETPHHAEQGSLRIVPGPSQEAAHREQEIRANPIQALAGNHSAQHQHE